MKRIKIFEEFQRRDLTEGQQRWLNSVVFGTWKVNAQGKVDVEGRVKCLDQKELKRFPVEFGRVSRGFECYNCPSLTTLEGAPQEVGGSFDCSDCTSLVTLEGCPRVVKKSFWCLDCSSLTTLVGASEKIEENFYVNMHNKIPQTERDLLERDKDLLLKWANSGMKIEDFLRQKRGTIKGREFGF